MNHIFFFSSVMLIVFATGICQADSLVITYRSGKTQTVTLDEPSQGINSWQFVSGIKPQQQSQTQDVTPSSSQQGQVQKEPTPMPQTDLKSAEKAPEKKSGIRVKWNAKPIPD